MGSFIKNLIALGGVVLIGVGGYYLVVIRQDATLEGNNSLVVSQAERETQEFLSRLDDLRTIELSSAIFSDPRFVLTVAKPCHARDCGVCFWCDRQ